MNQKFEVGGFDMSCINKDAVEVRESEWIKTRIATIAGETAWPQSTTYGRRILSDVNLTFRTATGELVQSIHTEHHIPQRTVVAQWYTTFSSRSKFHNVSVKSVFLVRSWSKRMGSYHTRPNTSSPHSLKKIPTRLIRSLEKLQKADDLG